MNEILRAVRLVKNTHPAYGCYFLEKTNNGKKAWTAERFIEPMRIGVERFLYFRIV